MRVSLYEMLDEMIQAADHALRGLRDRSGNEGRIRVMEEHRGFLVYAQLRASEKQQG